MSSSEAKPSDQHIYLPDAPGSVPSGTSRLESETLPDASRLGCEASRSVSRLAKCLPDKYSILIEKLNLLEKYRRDHSHSNLVLMGRFPSWFCYHISGRADAEVIYQVGEEILELLRTEFDPKKGFVYDPSFGGSSETARQLEGWFEEVYHSDKNSYSSEMYWIQRLLIEGVCGVYEREEVEIKIDVPKHHSLLSTLELMRNTCMYGPLGTVQLVKFEFIGGSYCINRRSLPRFLELCSKVIVLLRELVNPLNETNVENYLGQVDRSFPGNTSTSTDHLFLNLVRTIYYYPMGKRVQKFHEVMLKCEKELEGIGLD